MNLKPVDTAIIMIVGPVIDDTDFKSLEESIAYNAAGMDVSLIVEKTDGTTAVTAITLTTGGANDWTHTDGGYYEIEITAAQNSEKGIAFIRGICDGVLTFESPRYNISMSMVYGSLVTGDDVLKGDVTQWLGTAVATPAVAGVPKIQESTTHCATSGTILIGSQNSGSYADTCIDNASSWSIENTSEEVDVRFDFQIGAKRTPTYLECLMETITAGNLNFYAYNYMTSAWEKLNHVLLYSSSITEGSYGVALTSDHKDQNKDGVGIVQVRCVTDNHDLGENVYINLFRLSSIDSASIPSGIQLLERGKQDVNAEVDSAIVDGIGTAGAGLTDLGGMSTAMKSEVNDEIVDVIRVDTIPDSYPTDGSQPTIAQALLVIQQLLTEKSITGTTLSVKKPDGNTVAMTFTLNSSTAPTSITRAT